jgi:hypothetical protein
MTTMLHCRIWACENLASPRQGADITTRTTPPGHRWSQRMPALRLQYSTCGERSRAADSVAYHVAGHGVRPLPPAALAAGASGAAMNAAAVSTQPCESTPAWMVRASADACRISARRRSAQRYDRYGMMKNAVVAATSFTVTGITMLSLERSAGSVCSLSHRERGGVRG